MFAKWIDEDGRFSFSTVDNGGIEVGDDYHASLFSAQDDGKQIIRDAQGYPIAVERSPMPEDDSEVGRANKRIALLAEASLKIAPLQDATDLGIATESEASMLAAWKRYRVDLIRLNLAASSLEWPIIPA